MRKRNLVICCLWLLIAALGNTAYATEPYASIVVYNENIGNSKSDGHPNISPLGTLDIINMTPWDISFGDKPMNTEMLTGFAASSLNSFWMQGINTSYVTNPQASVNPAFAFHSIQIPLVDLNGVWTPLNKQLWKGSGDNGVPGAAFGGTTNLGTMQIVINSQNFDRKAAKTAALTFSVLSTAGFTSNSNGDITYSYPATALSFGDGTKNYGWRSNDTYVDMKHGGSVNYTNTTQFLTIQALTGENNWKPITNNLAGTAANKGTGGSAPGTTVQCPEYLTASGLAYPNFSSVAGITAVPGQSYDLVVILQAGGYVDSALIFLAVPSSNNALLKVQ